MKRETTGLLLALMLAGPALAQDWTPTVAACPDGQALQALAGLPDTAEFLVKVQYRDGRAQRAEMRIVKGLSDRRAQRHALHLVERALASCSGVAALQVRARIGPQLAGFADARVEPQAAP